MDWYFFWDSKIIGWLLLFGGLLSYLVDIRIKRKKDGRQLGLVTVGIVFLSLLIFVSPLVMFMIKSSGAFRAATEFIRSSPGIEKLIGPVKGFGLFTTGSLHSTEVNGVYSGEASFQITVHGTWKYMDISVDLQRKTDGKWEVVNLE